MLPLRKSLTHAHGEAKSISLNRPFQRYSPVISNTGGPREGNVSAMPNHRSCKCADPWSSALTGVWTPLSKETLNCWPNPAKWFQFRVRAVGGSWREASESSMWPERPIWTKIGLLFGFRFWKSHTYGITIFRVNHPYRVQLRINAIHGITAEHTP